MGWLDGTDDGGPVVGTVAGAFKGDRDGGFVFVGEAVTLVGLEVVVGGDDAAPVGVKLGTAVGIRDGTIVGVAVVGKSDGNTVGNTVTISDGAVVFPGNNDNC